MRDKCGILGVYSYKKSVNVSNQIYYGLYALQHRGQESAGISTYNNEKISTFRGMGLVCDVFNKNNMECIEGNIGIGHVRYSTTGKSKIENSQPFSTEFDSGTIAIAHNGDIINSSEIKNKLEKLGYKFESTTDSEIICHLLKEEYSKTQEMADAIRNITKTLLGSYSIVILINNNLFAVRDPHGIKPLSIGKKEDLTLVASETVAFDVVGAEYLRDVEPGEIIHINKQLKSYKLPIADKPRKAHCIFEYIYFARPDSILEGIPVYDVRLNIGRALSREFPADADVVMPIPDSAITAAIGYSRESGLGYGEGLIKNRYVGRTFIMPTQEERESSVKLKMNPIKTELKDKSIILVDDSIVRGTTSKSLVKLLREAGVKEIHLRVGCPPIISPCYYGIAMATKKELIASDKEIEEIRNILDVDSLGYLSLKSLVDSIGIENNNLCMGCLTGEYPTHIPDNITKYETYRC
ncbi:MAG: amidophosphoribosyltransferase [Methanobacterium sp.]|nr:amidophosphoribosyltransferase [Methanobacterium sp.]